MPAGEDGTVQLLTELRERRGFQCRLTPDRALRSLAEADEFLRDRGVLTRTADCAVPSPCAGVELSAEEGLRPGFPDCGAARRSVDALTG